MNREIKFRVSAAQTTIGYEMLMDGVWFRSEDGANFINGTFGGKSYKREYENPELLK